MNKRPRHYAEEICEEPEKKKRGEMLSKVPEQYRDTVKRLVNIRWTIERFNRGKS